MQSDDSNHLAVSAPLQQSLIANLCVDGKEAKTRLDEFIDGLGLPPYLVPEPAFVMTWPGHSTAICKIAASRWRSGKMTERPDKTLIMPDPSWHFDIHFEVQVIPKLFKVGLYLHYETSPYFSQAKLKSRLDASSLEQYLTVRNAFVHRFSQACRVPGFVVANRPLQIGKVEYDCRGKPFQTGSDELATICMDVAEVVNAVLLDLQRIPPSRLDALSQEISRTES